MKTRELFLKYLLIKQRLLARPDAIISNHKRRPSAYSKSLKNVQDEASRMNLTGLPDHELSLINQILKG
jgi:hypothetical protein